MPEGGGGKGAEGLVRAAVRERRAPEVVEEEVGEGGAGPDVVVLEYCPPGKGKMTEAKISIEITI